MSFQNIYNINYNNNQMRFKNIHCHTIKLFCYENNKFILRAELEKDAIKKIFNPTDYQGIVCMTCNSIFNDFNSNFTIQLQNNNNNRNNNNFQNFNASIFSEKDERHFEFFKLHGLNLIGSKNEIISYIIDDNNSLKNKFDKEELSHKTNIDKLSNDLKKEKATKNKLEKKVDKLNEDLNKEKNQNILLTDKLDNITKESNENVRKALEQAENEKQNNEKLSSKIFELQNKVKQEYNENKNLRENIKEKEKEISNLLKNNKFLENNVEAMKKNLALKDNEIKDIKITIHNLSKDLVIEKEKNKELKNKLDNISFENNNNVKKVLEQVEDEKKVNKNLKSKISELELQEKENNDKKDKLESQLRNKEKELEDVKKSIPEKNGLQFKSDCQIGEYDIILDITSFKDLVNGGWKVKYKDGKKENYINYMNEDTIIVGVIGNGNKGKTFILEQLSGYKLKQGFNVKTEGLSIRYGREKEHIIAILDSAGQETPLLKMDKENNKDKNIKDETDEFSKKDANDKANEKEERINEEKDEKIGEKIQSKKDNDQHSNKEQKSESEEIEFEIYSRDKLITEYFIQRFIIDKSDILILVVGNITLTEQKLLSRVKTEIKNRNSNKRIYVIHNLKNYSTDEQVNDYIENILKKLYKIEIKENNYQNADGGGDGNKKDDNQYFKTYFVEKEEKVSHFIFVNQFSDKANYYNVPTIRYIKRVLETRPERHPFPVIDDCKKFLVSISEEIMEECPNMENLITKEEEQNDKIILKDCKEINLKKFVIDEMGYALNNFNNEPKYSYYINTEDKNFYVNIELPGGGHIAHSIDIKGPFYCFIYEGEKKGDEIIENDKKEQIKKLKQTKNLRKRNKFSLEIKVPCSEMQIIEDLDEAGETSNDGKGVYTYKYKIKILGDKKEKKKIKRIDL